MKNTILHKNLYNTQPKEPLSEVDFIILELFKKRKAYFEAHLKKSRSKKVCCSACAYPTMQSHKSYEICPICSWEQNGYGETELLWPNHNADENLTLLDYRLLVGAHIKLDETYFSNSDYFKKTINLLGMYDRDYTLLVKSFYIRQNYNEEKKEFDDTLKKLNDALLIALQMQPFSYPD